MKISNLVVIAAVMQFSASALAVDGEESDIKVTFCDSYFSGKESLRAHYREQELRAQLRAAWEKGQKNHLPSQGSERFQLLASRAVDPGQDLSNRVTAAGEAFAILDSTSAAISNDIAVSFIYGLFAEMEPAFLDMIQRESFILLRYHPAYLREFENRLNDQSHSEHVRSVALQIASQPYHLNEMLASPQVLADAALSAVSRINATAELKHAVVTSFAALLRVAYQSDAVLSSEEIHQILGKLAEDAEPTVAGRALYYLMEDYVFEWGFSTPVPKAKKNVRGGRRESLTAGWYELGLRGNHNVSGNEWLTYRRGFNDREMLTINILPVTTEAGMAADAVTVFGKVWRMALQETEIPLRIWASHALLRIDPESVGHDTMLVLFEDLLTRSEPWQKFFEAAGPEVFQAEADRDILKEMLMDSAWSSLSEKNQDKLRFQLKLWIQRSESLSPDLKASLEDLIANDDA